MAGPAEIEHIPWVKVHEYQMDLGSSRARNQFRERVVPLGNTKSLTGALLESKLGVAFHRSRCALDFTDLESAILTVVCPHIQPREVRL
jgi:hypothetical protein